MATYTIPAVGDGTEPLDAPAGLGHAALHDLLGSTIQNVDTRISVLEAGVTDTEDHITQARMVANTWNPVTPAANQLIAPILWNLTARESIFMAAQVTAMTPPSGGSLTVNLLLSAALTSGSHAIDLDPSHMTPITSSPLTVAAGDNLSDQVTDFALTSQPVDTFVVAIITNLAGAAGISIQLNRAL